MQVSHGPETTGTFFFYLSRQPSAFIQGGEPGVYNATGVRSATCFKRPDLTRSACKQYAEAGLRYRQQWMRGDFVCSRCNGLKRLPSPTGIQCFLMTLPASIVSPVIDQITIFSQHTEHLVLTRKNVLFFVCFQFFLLFQILWCLCRFCFCLSHNYWYKSFEKKRLRWNRHILGDEISFSAWQTFPSTLFVPCTKIKPVPSCSCPFCQHPLVIAPLTYDVDSVSLCVCVCVFSVCVCVCALQRCIILQFYPASSVQF